MPLAVPQSKFEKLARECQQTIYQLPCKTNQKWYCQLEQGRWRKHKCKQQLQYPTPANKVFKKCACITAEGLVYKRILVNNTLAKRNTRLNRFRRDPDLFRILSQGISGKAMNRRQRRDTLSHVENAMESVKDKISGLQAVNSSLHDQITFEPSLDTNTISRTAPECIVLSNGKVNCPVAIYHDRKTWRRSRHQVENEIQQLKDKLEKLKEIRRHLKHTKPIHIMDDIGEFNTTDNSDTIGFNQVHVNLAPPGFELPWFPATRRNYDNLTTERSVENVSQSNSKPRNPENHHTGRRRRPKIEFDEVTPEIENSTKTMKVTNVTNHHRHSHRHHKHHTTTKGYADIENATMESTSEGSIRATSGIGSTTHRVRFVDSQIKAFILKYLFGVSAKDNSTTSS